MNKITLTRDQIHAVMEELKRRLDLDIADGTVPFKWQYIREEISTRMQGVYGTIMAIVSNENWREIVWWFDDEIDKLYSHYGYDNAMMYDEDKNSYEWE